jgi:DNA-binding transcriptional regulator YdaS (Cro superfamily)
MCWFVHSGARSCGMHRLLQTFGVRTTMIGTRCRLHNKEPANRCRGIARLRDAVTRGLHRSALTATRVRTALHLSQFTRKVGICDRMAELRKMGIRTVMVQAITVTAANRPPCEPAPTVTDAG